MPDLTITIRLDRGQTIELTQDEAAELRDCLVRLLAPRIEPQAPGPWPPVVPVWPKPYEVTCIYAPRETNVLAGGVGARHE